MTTAKARTAKPAADAEVAVAVAAVVVVTKAAHGKPRRLDWLPLKPASQPLS